LGIPEPCTCQAVKADKPEQIVDDPELGMQNKRPHKRRGYTGYHIGNKKSCFKKTLAAELFSEHIPEKDRQRRLGHKASHGKKKRVFYRLKKSIVHGKKARIIPEDKKFLRTADTPVKKTDEDGKKEGKSYNKKKEKKPG
jgi:hypothetical protein